MKKYCPQCKCERDVFFNSKEETYHIRESDITITAEIATCTICGEEIVDFEHDDANFRKAYDQYKVINGLLTSQEIKEIRECYEVPQVAFARILGVGDKTIARYENGSLQDEAINNLIMLAKDPHNFQKLLDKNKAKISKDEFERIEAKIRMLKELKIRYSPSLLDRIYSCKEPENWLEIA